MGRLLTWVFALTLPCAASAREPVGMMISFDQQESMPLVFSKRRGNTGTSLVEIDLKDRKQEIFGFGATLTQASVKNLNRLKPAVRQAIMEKIFSPTKGYGLNFIRVPIGATDFSDPKDGNFSYDDLPAGETDPQLKKFSMKKDEPTFAMLREIMKLNPDVRFMLSAWSAPGWMKDSGSLQGGWLKDEYVETFGRYLVKVVEEYKKMGIPVDSMTMINEPGVYWAPFTCMGMDPKTQGTVLAKVLGPALRKIDPKIRFLALDHNWGMSDHVAEQIKAVPESEQYIDGIAYHCYGGTVQDMTAAQKRFPGKLIYQTECSPYEARMKERRWYMGWWIDNQVIEGGRNWASSGMGWNIALDEFYGPHQSFCRNCRGLISIYTKDGTITNEYPELRALGLATKYTGRGTFVLGSASKDKDIGHIAYVNKDGSKVAVLRNRGKVTKHARIKDSTGRVFALEIPSEHAVSVKW